MKQIISIDGIDGSGKSTQIDSIVQELQKYGIESHSTHEMPDNFVNRHLGTNHWDFFRYARIENVVSALLKIAKEKDSWAKTQEGYTFLDRGAITTASACVARLMARMDYPLAKALIALENINGDVVYKPSEDVAIVLTTQNPKQTYSQRCEPEGVSEVYDHYLNILSEIFPFMAAKKYVLGTDKPRSVTVNADQAKETVTAEVLDALGKVSDVKYWMLMNQFIADAKNASLDSVIIGGSMARDEIVPGWSDIDAVVFVKEKSDRARVKELAVGYAKKYGIRFNPLVASEEKDLTPKARIFMVPEYGAKTLFGQMPFTLDTKTVGMGSKEDIENMRRFYKQLETDYSNGNITQDAFLQRGLRVCFNMSRHHLLEKKGIVCSSYAIVSDKAKEDLPQVASALEYLRGCRNDMEHTDRAKMERVIRNTVKYLGGFR